MSRYFFHVEDGDTYVDLQGTELPSLAEAKQEAVRFAAALLSDHIDEFWNAGEWMMRVTDADDLTLFTLTFLANNSPATELATPSS